MTECSRDRDEVIFHHCMDSGGGAVLKGHQKGHEGVSVQSLKEIVNTWFVLLNHREDNTEDSSKKSDEFSHIWCEWISVCMRIYRQIAPDCMFRNANQIRLLLFKSQCKSLSVGLIIYKVKWS